MKKFEKVLKKARPQRIIPLKAAPEPPRPRYDLFLNFPAMRTAIIAVDAIRA